MFEQKTDYNTQSKAMNGSEIQNNNPPKMSRSSMWHSNNCCFFVPLEAGCFIIGYLNLIAHIIAIILMIWTTVDVFTTESPKHINAYFNFIVTAITIVFIILMLALAFGVILLVGLHKKRPKLVNTFIIYRAIFLVIQAPLIYLSFSIANIIHFLISVYFLIALNNHYENMKRNETDVMVKGKDCTQA